MFHPSRRWPWALTGAAVIALLPVTGCSSMPWSKKAKAEPQPLVNHNFHDHLASAVTAIKAAELDAASQQLDAADAAAKTLKEREQVESLRKLVAGARAMMAGQGQRAADAWSQIPDSQLRLQVRDRSTQLGFRLPKPNTDKNSETRIAER